MASKETSICRQTNSLKTNLFKSALNRQDCAKAVFFIKELSARMNLPMAGLMCALINRGLRTDKSVKEYLQEIEKKWNDSEEKKMFDEK